jgi:hypothetical protein
MEQRKANFKRNSKLNAIQTLGEFVYNAFSDRLFFIIRETIK